ncbi:hypothetical protein V501_08731, partial [Pseudogymnoascus sp. VKM F-4519 (FW-2642)]
YRAAPLLADPPAASSTPIVPIDHRPPPPHINVNSPDPRPDLNKTSSSPHNSQIPKHTALLNLHTLTHTQPLHSQTIINMKYSIVFVGALAALASAQSVSDLTACGQQCVKSMLAQAATLGCSTTDSSCLCNKSDFAYGIRDCANEACGSDAPKIIAYGTAFCKGNNGGSDSGAGGASSSGSGAGAGAGSATGTAASSSASATDGAGGAGGAVGGGAGASGSGASGSGAEGGPVPITTSAVVSDSKTVGSTTIYSSDASATPVSTVTSDGKAVTTLFGAAGGANGGSGSGSGGDVSTVTSGSSTFVTTVSSGSGSASTSGSDSGNGGAAGGAGSGSSTGGSGSGTSTSSAGGARQTAAAAGVMAVAGLAAFVL